MNHTCEFAVGSHPDAGGFPIIDYCEAPAVNFKDDRWLCPEHYKKPAKVTGGYIYRQGTVPVSTTKFSKKFSVTIKK